MYLVVLLNVLPFQDRTRAYVDSTLLILSIFSFDEFLVWKLITKGYRPLLLISATNVPFISSRFIPLFLSTFLVSSAYLFVLSGSWTDTGNQLRHVYIIKSRKHKALYLYNTFLRNFQSTWHRRQSKSLIM